jgi:hypothetical protein
MLAFILLMNACGPAATETGRQPAAQVLAHEPISPLPAASRSPTDEPAWTEMPPPTPSPTLAPTELLVLHTNDNWGETEPCG